MNDMEARAVEAAEAFVLRHGYTIAGHPDGLPVENAEVLDPLMPRDHLVALRHGMIEPRAFGVARAKPTVYYVYFRHLSSPSSFRAVLVQQGVAVQMVHSHLDINWLPWVRVNERQAQSN
jgi:hypothetical protein